MVQEAQDYLSEELTGEIMTIAQQLEKKGFGKAMVIAQQWKEEGLQQGEANILKLQLQHRFGQLSGSHIQRIDSADTQTLFEWAAKILEAKTLEDVFN